MTVADLTETELVARIQQRLLATPPWVVVGIGDDAAVVETERNRLEVLTVDAIVEGVHFDRRFTPPDAIGHRALAVNLSDLAAMGAKPRLALLSFVLPITLTIDDFDAIVDGFARLAARHQVHVVGGNLTRTTGPLAVDVTAIGTAKRRQVLTRAGALPGHEIYVTGTVGGSARGLRMLRDAVDRGAPGRSPGELRESEGPNSSPGERESIRRYLYPEPRVRAGLLFGRNRAASACVDLSDGVADGVRRIAGASGVGAVIDFSQLPRVEPSWTDANTHDPGVTLLEAEAYILESDDYELLATVAPRSRRRFLAAANIAGICVTKVGVCTKEPELQLINAPGGGAAFPQGFSHFR